MYRGCRDEHLNIRIPQASCYPYVSVDGRDFVEIRLPGGSASTWRSFVVAAKQVFFDFKNPDDFNIIEGLNRDTEIVLHTRIYKASCPNNSYISNNGVGEVITPLEIFEVFKDCNSDYLAFYGMGEQAKESDMVHYSGSLGEFDYDPAQFQVSLSHNGKECLRYIGTETDGRKIKIPDGVIDCNNMFYGHKDLLYAAVLPENVRICDSMYGECTSLVIPGDLSKNITSADRMFSHCLSLAYAPAVYDGFASDSLYPKCKQGICIVGDWHSKHPGKDFYKEHGIDRDDADVLLQLRDSFLHDDKYFNNPNFKRLSIPVCKTVSETGYAMITADRSCFLPYSSSKSDTELLAFVGARSKDYKTAVCVDGEYVTREIPFYQLIEYRNAEAVNYHIKNASHKLPKKAKSSDVRIGLQVGSDKADDLQKGDMGE